MRTKAPKNKPIAWLGVDPGKTGAAILLLEDYSLKIFDWPKSNNYFEVYRAIRMWKFIYRIRMSVMEKVASMTGQGVKSVWSFSGNYHAWQMLLIALDIRHRLLTPAQWQKGLLSKTDGPEPKARVQNVACRIFAPEYFFGPKGGYKDGRGDAALMAYKARQIDMGEEK